MDLGGDLKLDNGLRMSLTGYLIYRDGNTTNTMSELISAYGMSSIAYYTNYNRKRTVGGELTLGWGRKMGDWNVDVEGSLTSWRTVNVKVANDYPLYDWQRLTGRDESAITGYVCIGRFETPEQIATLPKLDETGTQLGDLRYQDLNQDGKIDTNDQRVIGNSNPWLRGYLNLSVGYKDFTFTLTGTGHAFSDVAALSPTTSAAPIRGFPTTARPRISSHRISGSGRMPTSRSRARNCPIPGGPGRNGLSLSASR